MIFENIRTLTLRSHRMHCIPWANSVAAGKKDRDSVDQGLCLYWGEKWGGWGFMGLLFIGEFKI